MKKSLIATIVIVLIIVIGAGAYALVRNNNEDPATNNVSNDTMMEDTTKKDDSMMEDNSMKDNSMQDETKNDSMMEDNSTKGGDAMNKTESSVGSYVTYAAYTSDKQQYDTGNVVLFFNASWCPTCKALTKDINANLSSIPSGTTIVSVDYDSSSDLKKKYGVTYQHTLVKIDASGNQIKKWSGSPTLSSLISEI